MAFSPLFRSWHYVYSCFVNPQSLNSSKVIINMAKCTFSTQCSLGQKQNAELEVEGQVEVVSDSETDVKASEEDSKKTILVVGLGNCERRETRHSIGMQVLDKISKHLKLSWQRDDFKKSGGFLAKTSLAPGVDLILLKPRVPMNLNGICVAKAARAYQVLPDDIYVIHDDLDEAIGTFKWKESGSAGGHNGVRSVIRSMRTEDIKRLRIGIDRPSSEDEIIEYVLSEFSFDQELAMLPAISSGVSSLFQHIGQQCNVTLDVTLSTNPKSLQFSGFRITKPKNHKQRKWDSESEFETPNFQYKQGFRNSGKYGNSRMNKWEDSDERPRNWRNFRYDNDSNSDDFPRQRRTSRSNDFSKFDDFPRQRRTRSDDFSEFDDFPRQRGSRSDDSSKFDDFPRKRTSRSDDFSELDDIPRNRRTAKSDDFSETTKFPRQKRNSRRSDDFDESDDSLEDQWDDFNDYPQRQR